MELTDSLRHPSEADLPDTVGAIERSALSRRSDLLAAAADANAIRRETSAISAERLPSVSAYASVASSATGLLDYRTYGVAVSLPIFDGFRREARVAESRAREREAEARYQDARRRVQVEVRTALVELSSARERVAATGAQLRLAEQEVAQARERFRNGVASNADVVAASLTLNSARDATVDALARYHAARVQLAYADGTIGAMP